MIEIRIIVKDGKVLDQLNNKESTLEEIGAALLSLKQIEHKLIDKEFISDVEIEE